MLLSHVLSLEGRKRRERRVINIPSGSGTGDFEGLIRIEVGQEDSYLCRWMPHKTLSTTGKTERAEKQRTKKKSRQTLSTFCLDFGWIQGDGIEGLQRAGWIEATQRAKNARKGA